MDCLFVYSEIISLNVLNETTFKGLLITVSLTSRSPETRYFE